jgi:glutathione S-transferase
MESMKIAHALEARYPSPSLRLDSPYLPKVNLLTEQVMNAIAPDIVNWITKEVVNEASLPYWNKTREAILGSPLDVIEREKGGSQVYEVARDALLQVTSLLKENHGPFFEGEDVGFADFQWVGFLMFLKLNIQNAYENVMQRVRDGDVHLKLMEACQAWTERYHE